MVISSTYPDKQNSFYGGIFVKEQIGYLKDHFENIYVVCPLPIGYLCNLTDYSYENVHVFFPRFFHAPFEIFRKRLGKRFFNVVNKTIKKNDLKFDLIHAHFTWPSGYAGAKLKNIYGVPLITTAHGSDIRNVLSKKISKNYLKSDLNYTFDICDVIHTNHEELRDLIIKNYPQYQNKVIMTYKGIDINKFSPKSNNDGIFTVLF